MQGGDAGAGGPGAGSPVRELSLATHSPATSAASQGISTPSSGSTRQSPGTSWLESTHSSSAGKRKPQRDPEEGRGRPQPPPPPPSLPQLSPPPGRHTHTRTDSLTMSLRVWLCCNQGDKQGVDGWSPSWGPTCPALPHPPHITHLSGFVQREADGDGGDEEDAQGVPVVVVSQPQPDAEGLEPVVGVQCLGRGGGGSRRQCEARGSQGSPAQGAECPAAVTGPQPGPVSPSRRPSSPSFFALHRTWAPEKHFV